MRPASLRLMTPRADWPAIREGLERSVRIALALVALVVVVVYVVGRQAGIEEARIAAEKAARTAALTTRSPPPAVPRAPPRAPPSGAPAGGAAASPAKPSPTPVERAPADLPPPAPPGLPEAEESAAAPPGKPPPRLVPRPIVVDSATFLVERGKIRLADVQPVAPSRECGPAGRAWPCGMEARTALSSHLSARSIRCDVPETFGSRNETLDAACSLGADDIGLWLVENGWARARQGGAYTAAEARARAGRRGIWGNAPRGQ